MNGTINELKQGLLKCANENENRTYLTGQVIISSICKDAKNYIEELEKEKCELLGILQKKDELIKNLICCANCKYGTQGDYDCFENCGSCHATDCECEIKSPTKNSYGKYHDWDDKCDNWELAE